MYEPARIRLLKAGHPQEDDRDGARYLVDELKSAIIRGAGDPQGRYGSRYRALYVALVATAERLGIRFRLEQDSLGSFVKEHPGLDRAPQLLRASIIDPPFAPLLDLLDNPGDRRLLEPVQHAVTSWTRVDEEIAELRVLAAGASTGHDRGAVGRLCREVFVSLAHAAYDEERHGPLPRREDGAGGGTVKSQIEAVIRAEARGGDLADVRSVTTKVLDLANRLQHRKSPPDAETMICADATIFVVMAVRRLTDAGQRTEPHRALEAEGDPEV